MWQERAKGKLGNVATAVARNFSIVPPQKRFAWKASNSSIHENKSQVERGLQNQVDSGQVLLLVILFIITRRAM